MRSAPGRRVLVSGGTGFIGSRLTDALLASGADVHWFARPSVSRPGVTVHHGDLEHVRAIRHVMETVRPDVVMHLAGYVTGDRSLRAIARTFRANTVATVNLLNAASLAGSPRVVVAGSREEPGVEEGFAAPGHPYAASKTAASAYARMFESAFSLPVVVLRVFLVYGPANPHATQLVPYVTQELLAGRSPLVTDGDQCVDLVYVDDVVDAFLAAAESDATGVTADVGSGALRPVRDIIGLIETYVGSTTGVRWGAQATRANEHERVADIRQAHQLLGWAPSVGLEEGLARTVDWYRGELERR